MAFGNFHCLRSIGIKIFQIRRVIMGMSDAAEFLKTLEVESKPYFIRAWRGIRKREVDVVGTTKMLEIVKEEG